MKSSSSQEIGWDDFIGGGHPTGPDRTPAPLGDIEQARAEQRRTLFRTDRETAVQCLAGIDPARLDYQQWVNVGMALHSAGASVADWDSWSRADSARFKEGDCAKRWAGFNGSGVGVGTLVKMSRDMGGTFSPPARKPAPQPAGVSFYSSKHDRTGRTMPLEEILDGIKGGRWADAVKPVRAAVEAGDDTAKDAAKGRLPAFIPSGLFSTRSKAGLTAHSGLIVADVDKLPTPEHAASLRDALAQDSHVQSAFISPSGRGVKALIAVEPVADALEHSDAFAKLAQHFVDQYGVDLDQSGKDVSRLCFVSHDAGAFIRTGTAARFKWREPVAAVAVVVNPLAGRKSLAELAATPPDGEQTLLGNRYLCRRGCMLYVGRSGLGKSSSSAQQDILFSLGREAFGIAPAKPLNILCIQAENDDGDLHEMAAGVLIGLGLTEEEIAEVHKRTTYLQWFESGEAFLAKLRAALTAERDAGRPVDLVRIDPLLSFAGGDLASPDVIASFCRAGLNSIAFDFDCGIIAVHHTPKINLTARPRMDGPEWIYAATGCADLSNWARAILVVADSPNAMPGTFRMIGAKRGKRITWRDSDGEMEFERYFSHAQNGGGMFWREATMEEKTTATVKASAAKERKVSALERISDIDEGTMKAKALNIVSKGPLVSADFHKGVMREFKVNEKDARTVSKWLTDGDGKAVKVAKIGKAHWHGTADQLTALQNPPLAGVK